MSFFEMGGYAAYVWPAFGVAALIMIVLLILSVRALRAREATLKNLEAARGPRPQRGVSNAKSKEEQKASA
jgi:heme exporter protein D